MHCWVWGQKLVEEKFAVPGIVGGPVTVEIRANRKTHGQKHEKNLGTAQLRKKDWGNGHETGRRTK